MYAWIRSLRLRVCVLAGFLVVASFRVAGTPVSWISVAAVFFIACATMLQNDWRDRYHDRRKGKVLVLEHPGGFLTLVLVFWAISFGLIVAAALVNKNLSIVLAPVALLGLFHVEFRRVPMAPVTLVALGSGSPALLPLAVGADEYRVWLLFLATSLAIFGREITKDIDDLLIDGGYKWTIPLAVGSTRTRIIAALAIMAACVVWLRVSFAEVPAMLVAMVGASILVRGSQPKTARAIIDVGIVLALLTIIVLRI